MKVIRPLVIALFLVAGFSTVGLSQSVAQPSLGKVVVINSAEFGDEKAGITKYVSALRNLSTEFAPLNTELKSLNTRYETLRREIASQRQQMEEGKIPIDEAGLQKKIDDADRLELEIKYRSDDAKLKFERRQQAMLTPVMRDIYAALQEFTKQKGFLLVIDVAKDRDGVVAAIGDDKAVVTKDFIAYYNARPAALTTPR